MFRLGYNTNGLAHHRVVDALRLCAELGYEGVAITPDAGLLDPFDLNVEQVHSVARWAEDLGLELAVETGSRFLLDARRKHRPTLLEEDAGERARRAEFLERCVDLAADLGAQVVSFWAGAPPPGEHAHLRGDDPASRSPELEALWDRLCEGTLRVLARGRAQGVPVAFEPEPGMFVERPRGYEELVRRLGPDGDELGLCLDVGHCLVTGDLPVDAVIRRYAERLYMVHLDDIADGVHEHLMFGQGALDLPATLGALVEIGYDGMAAVELSRDAHRGPEAAREALQHLHAALTAPPA